MARDDHSGLGEDSGKPVQFVLNDKHVSLDNVSPHALLIDYLHSDDVGLFGQKLVCGEAGCGACTVMETSWDPISETFVKRAINSCVRPLASIDGMVITTTEGIGSTREGMDPVQYALAAHNGSQCGYCSGGFVMNMYTLLQNKPPHLTEKQIEQTFDGHICRCTGYRPILDGFKTFADDYTPPSTPQSIQIANNYVPIISEFKVSAPPPHFTGYMKEPNLAYYTNGWESYARATDEETLGAILSELTIPGGSRFVSGNTSIGIYKPIQIYGEETIAPRNYIDISRVKSLQALAHDVAQNPEAPQLSVGAGVTLSQLITLLETHAKEGKPGTLRAYEGIVNHLKVVANHQVREVATIAGNVAMATLHGFLSDVIILLASLRTQVDVTLYSDDVEKETFDILSLPTEAELNGATALYTNFTSQTGLGPDWYFSSHKVRARPDNSHAYVNNAVSMQIHDGTVADATIVYNGVQPQMVDGKLRSVGGNPAFKAVRFEAVEHLLIGKKLDDALLEQTLAALDQALDKVMPANTAQPVESVPWAYRRSLAAALWYKAFSEIRQQVDGVSDPVHADVGALQRGVSHGQQSYNDYPEELPVSAPLLKLSAFMQTTGEAEYTQTLDRPSGTWEGAYVYSQAAKGTFHFRNTVGEKTTAAGVCEDLISRGFDKLRAIIAYDDVPNKTGNWAGMGYDEPLFVPPEGSAIPEPLLEKAKEQATFEPTMFTSSGAPLALVLADTREDARELAAFIRYNNIVETPAPDPILTLNDAVAKGSAFENNPPTSPTLERILEISRPGSNAAWLVGKAEIPAAKTVTGTHRTGAQNHFYLETQTTLAVPGENGAMTVHASTQNLADNQYGAAAALGVRANQVSVKLVRVGGGFGGKQMRTPFSSSAAAVAAAAAGRPVRLMLDRNTNMIMQGNRHPFEADYRVAFQPNGRIEGMKVDFRSDGGCTYDISFNVMDFVQLLADNVYDIPTWQTTGTVYRTNKISSTAYRGFGIIQCMNILEGIIARVAHETGLSVEEVRAQNLYERGRPVAGPYTLNAQALAALMSMEILSEDELKSLEGLKDQVFNAEPTFREALAKAAELSPAQTLRILDMSTQAHGFTPYMQPLDKFDMDSTYQTLVRDPEYGRRVADVAAFNKANRWKKRGLYAMPLKYGNAFTGPRGALNQGGAYVLAYSEDGSVLVRHGGVELGQGIQTQMAQIAAQTLGIPIVKVQVGSTTTEVIGDAAPTAASTASDLNGGAVELACKQLRERLEDFCRNLEQFSYRDIQHNRTASEAGYKAMVETVVNNWRTRWAECWDMIISLAFQNRINLASSARYAVPDYTAVDGRHPIGNPFLYHLYSAAISEVELDVLTGEWNFLRADIRGDIGKSLNPLLDVGQIEGAFIQGLGYLTTEEMLWQTEDYMPIEGFDPGSLTTYGTWAYKPPTINSIPEDFRVSIVNNDGTDAVAMNENGSEPADSGVKASKGASEFGLVLANSAFYALHAAVMAARADAGKTDWPDLEAPATVPRLQMASMPTPDALLTHK